MNRFQTLLAASAALFALPAFAQDGLTVTDAYAISRGAVGSSGAVFFTVENHTATEDRLTGAASDVAAKNELHTHQMNADGVMAMVHVPEGFVVPADGDLVLERGGKHVMLMGLTREVKDGDVLQITLTFEHAGEMVLEVPVDNNHVAAAAGQDGMAHDMSKMTTTKP